ncbi:MAG: class I SAM-dependent methyltransferase [Acidobacteria bacterium]|nr:class I SAM-dependent methyltransferase [Acidobacteriota bacterium]
MEARINNRMRADWNRRARQDANYYVAFGRHGQDDGEFFSTADEVVYGLEYELKRLPAGGRWRALEIGCGPGRLMKPLSRHFGEIHGVDVSDEMVRLAREKLRSIANAHVHVNAGMDLRQFADESFDFVYSYAVFQHIPSREVVYSYLCEARRVLKSGGLFWFQVNGLPQPQTAPDTWSGVRFTAQELIDFANQHDFQMYTLEGVHSQYLWTSLRKRPSGWHHELLQQQPPTEARIRRISNPHGTEPVVPSSGRFAVASLWIENLHPECGLNHLCVRIGEAWGTPNYIAAPLPDGQQQMNVVLPQGVPTGLVPVDVQWCGRPMAAAAAMRVVPPGPRVPRLLSVTDATDLLCGTRIVTGAVKVTMEELAEPGDAQFRIDGRRISEIAVHCADPRPPRFEFIFRLDDVDAGVHLLEIQAGRRPFPPVELDVVGGSPVTAPY